MKNEEDSIWLQHNTTQQPTSTMEFNEENEDDELFYVDLCGKQIFIKEDIPLVKVR